MIFRQITHDDLGCASYLVGDDDAAVAAVVDPRLDIDEYLRLARYLGVRIEHVLETHNHADHVSGHGRLAASTGAAIHIHRAAEPEYDHEPFDDGWELALGRLVVRALHTPGHRPEHTAFALIDTERGPEPWAVLTGDSLFVGGIARPDLAVVDAEAFVERAVAGLGPQPPNFRAIVAINTRPLARGLTQVDPLTPRQVEQHQRDGALVVDVRTELQFDDAHIPGAICITVLRAGFGSRLAWLADHDQPVVVVGRDDDDARGAIGLAASVGVTNVAGYLAGGMTSWREDQLRVARIPRMTVPELHERWEDGPPLQVLDVRELSEWQSGHIPGAVHTPYHDIHALPEGVDADVPVAVICASGQRAAVGASLLARHGAREVVHVVDGGVGAWGRAGWPLEKGAG